MPEIPETLRSQVKGAARRTQGVLVLFVFGSQVNGRAWAESDFDVAVRWDAKLGHAERDRAVLSLIRNLTDALGHLGETADVTDLDRADSAAAFQAVQNGICVYEASKSERVRAIVDVMRRFDDEAPRRELFRRAAIRAATRAAEAGRG